MTHSGPKVLFKTCVAMKFVDDDDDDQHLRPVSTLLLLALLWTSN